MGWLIVPLLIIVVIIGIAFVRSANSSYRFGSGIFKRTKFPIKIITTRTGY